MLKKSRLFYLGLALALGLFSAGLLAGCVYIVSIDQPAEVHAGDVFNITLTAASDHTGTDFNAPYYSINLPDGWQILPPADYTGTYTGSLAFDSDIANQLNLYHHEDGYSWWSGRGETIEAYTIDLTSTAVINVQTTGKPGFFYLDHMTGDTLDGPNYDSQLDVPITVTAQVGSGWKTSYFSTIIPSSITTVIISDQLVNLGESGADSFALSGDWMTFTEGGSPVSQVGPLNFKEAASLKAEITLPAGLEPGWYDLTMQAQSLKDPNQVSQAKVRIGIKSDRKAYVMDIDTSLIRGVDPLLRHATSSTINPAPSSNPADGLIAADGSKLFVSMSGTNELVVYDLIAPANPPTVIPVGSGPEEIALTPDGSKVLVTYPGTNAVSIVDWQSSTNTTVPLGVAGGRTYGVAVNACTGEAYVTYSDGTNGVVYIVDPDTQAVTGQVDGDFYNPQEVVFSPSGDRGYVADGSSSLISVIDTADGKVIDTYPTFSQGTNVLGITADGGKLYAGDSLSGVLYIYDTSTGNLLHHLNFDYQTGPGLVSAITLSDIEVSPDPDIPYAFVASELNDRIFALDLETDEVVDSFEVTGPTRMAFFPQLSACSYASHLSPSPAHLFGSPGETLSQAMQLFNLTGGSTSYDLSLAPGSWGGSLSVASTPVLAHGQVYTFTVQVTVPNGVQPGEFSASMVTATPQNGASEPVEAEVTAHAARPGYVVDDTNQGVEILDTAAHLDTEENVDLSSALSSIQQLALSPGGDWLLVSLNMADEVAIVSTADPAAPVSYVSVGTGPGGIAFSGDGVLAYIANLNSQDISILNLESKTVTGAIPVGIYPSDLASSPCLDKLYVVDKSYDKLAVVDTQAPAVTKTIASGLNIPARVVVSPLGDRVYVLNTGPYGNIDDKGYISVLDTQTDTVIDTWMPGSYTEAMAISPDGQFLYVYDYVKKQILAVSTQTGQVDGTIDFEDQIDSFEAFPNGIGAFLYANSTASRRILVIDTGSFTLSTFIQGVYSAPMALFPPAGQCGLPPVAQFDLSATEISVGETVTFTNQSTGVPFPEFSWDFGDSSALSSQVDPVHSYTQPGSYTVELTAQNPFGSSTATAVVKVKGYQVFLPVVKR